MYVLVVKSINNLFNTNTSKSKKKVGAYNATVAYTNLSLSQRFLDYLGSYFFLTPWIWKQKHILCSILKHPKNVINYWLYSSIG